MSLREFSKIDYWSLAAVALEAYFDEKLGGRATGFLWQFAGKTYLVTACHVFSGQHWETKANLSPMGLRPNRVRAWFNPDGKPGFPKVPVDFKLKRGEERLWLEDPNKGSDVDVALLPIDLPSGLQTFPINELPQSHLEFGMGQSLFVLGYPLGLKTEPLLRLPIWKRASLASEPIIPEKIQPYWLVDTASRGGMSGAPVIQRAYDYELPLGELPKRLKNPGHKGKSSFVGVYSGRFKVPEDESDLSNDQGTKAVAREPEDFHLGIVWPSWCIERIIKSHVGDEAYDAELKRRRDQLQGKGA